MRSFVNRYACVAILACASVIGCGMGGTSLSGSVTFDGQPVNNGAITLIPQDGGPTLGAQIENGSYQIDEATPGKYLVQIVGFEKGPVVTSSADLEAMSRSRTKAPPTREIPADAVGNNVEIDIANGSQQRDFDLVPPK